MPSPFRFRRSRYTPPRPWEPLTDAEWAALSPYVTRAARAPGRPLLQGARARLDAVFRVVAGNLPWNALSAGRDGVAGATVSRQFRRWAGAGLFARLLRQVAKGRRARGVPEALRGLAHWICAAHRRSVRAVGVRAIALARRLGMLSALPGPPWMLPDPDLSELVRREVIARIDAPPGSGRPAAWEVRALARLLRVAAGRRRIRRCLVPA